MSDKKNILNTNLCVKKHPAVFYNLIARSFRDKLKLIKIT